MKKNKKRFIVIVRAKLIKDKIGEEYIQGDDTVTLEFLAQKYKKSERQIKRYSSENNWVKERELFRSKTALKRHEIEVRKFANQQVIATENHLEMCDKLRRVVNSLLNGYLKERELIEKGEKLKPKATACTVKLISETILNIQKAERTALNMDKELQEEDKEPQVVIIKGLDMEKI